MQKIIGISGSLRKGSYNSALLKAAEELLPKDMTLEVADIRPIPFYDGDLEISHFPESVLALREKIQKADGLLIATPEYNYSIPGVLKNTIDWLSRPVKDTVVLTGKPLALMGASPSMMGTARSQYHIRQSVVFLDMHLLNKPEVFISFAHTKFDDDLKLVDAPTREIVGQFLKAFQQWIQKLQCTPPK
jgi:chromate reductase